MPATTTTPEIETPPPARADALDKLLSAIRTGAEYLSALGDEAEAKAESILAVTVSILADQREDMILDEVTITDITHRGCYSTLRSGPADILALGDWVVITESHPIGSHPIGHVEITPDIDIPICDLANLVGAVRRGDCFDGEGWDVTPDVEEDSVIISQVYEPYGCV